MSSDPNGSRWTNSAQNFGKKLLRQSGWSEGSGLGKNHTGVVSHVKVVRKDDVMGIGYKAGVQETWTTQSVGFADVLDRIKTRTKVILNEDDDVEERGSDDGVVGEEGHSAHTASATSPTQGQPAESRHFKMYAKRNALKIEFLSRRTSDKADEILGKMGSPTPATAEETAAQRKRPREADAGEAAERNASTLKSPLLRRLMVRCPQHEPKATDFAQDAREDESEAAAHSRVSVTKPQPRPPRCTTSPFIVVNQKT